MSNYPPGVTGNEPQITGEWPCDVCGGMGYDEDEDGKHACNTCNGTGILPEDNIDMAEIRTALDKFMRENPELGGMDIEQGNDGSLIIYTSLFSVGGNWYRVGE